FFFFTRRSGQRRWVGDGSSAVCSPDLRPPRPMGRFATARLPAGGGGASGPLIARHRISFSSKSSILSYSLQSIFADRSAPYDFGVFFAFRSMRARWCRYPDRSGLSVKLSNIGRAAASYWDSGGKPRISSIVRTMLTVLYCVLSTNRRFVYGLTTRPTVRWASTWSGPFWASSSITKIAVCGQSELFDTASTSRPNARSLLATHARGVYAPGGVPAVWSSPRLMTMNRGMVPAFANARYSVRNVSTLSVSRTLWPVNRATP